jgi:hypothetical protein
MATAGPFASGQSNKLLAWKKRVESMNLFVPRDQAALWTGFTPAEAKALAKRRGLKTLEATDDGESLDSGELCQLLDADFGKGKSDERAVVWLWASEKFAGGLQGKVTVLVKQGELVSMTGHDERLQKAVFDELMRVDVLSPLRHNPSVTEINVVEVDIGGRPSWVFTVPRSRMWQ